MQPQDLIDLHTHSNASDGALAPAALLDAASRAGVSLLAITDHDTTAAYTALPPVPRGLRLVTGIEFSTWWQRRGVHVVGLGIATDCDAMRAALAHQGAAREARAQAIAEQLRRRGIPDAYAGAAALAAGGVIGRPHFAAYLVASGAARDPGEAFRKYLGEGRAVHGLELWAPLARIIGWIRDAGGTAVLAHPAHYRLTRSRLAALVADFRAAGGDALELLSGTETPAVTGDLATLARAHDLAVSIGSDFHDPAAAWQRLGRQLPPLPGLRPVWERW